VRESNELAPSRSSVSKHTPSVEGEGWDLPLAGKTWGRLGVHETFVQVQRLCGRPRAGRHNNNHVLHDFRPPSSMDPWVTNVLRPFKFGGPTDHRLGWQQETNDGVCVRPWTFDVRQRVYRRRHVEVLLPLRQAAAGRDDMRHEAFLHDRARRRDVPIPRQYQVSHRRNGQEHREGEGNDWWR